MLDDLTRAFPPAILRILLSPMSVTARLCADGCVEATRTLGFE